MLPPNLCDNEGSRIQSACRARLRVVFIAMALAQGGLTARANAADYIPIAANMFTSVMANDAASSAIPGVSASALARVASFEMRETPVTNGEFLTFVKSNRKWQLGKVPSVFADRGYLSRWSASTTLGADAGPNQPVTNVSWFAAQAFCESEGARLPTWLEWELVAAADSSVKDARADPAWRAVILKWYSQPSTGSLPDVGGTANAYGVRNMHGLIWEWVDDFNALLVAADSRNQGDPDKLQFCGAGAISLKDRDNYAVLMRIALLSSLSAVDSTRNLGFRCARSTNHVNQTEVNK